MLRIKTEAEFLEEFGPKWRDKRSPNTVISFIPSMNKHLGMRLNGTHIRKMLKCSDKEIKLPYTKGNISGSWIITKDMVKSDIFFPSYRKLESMWANIGIVMSLTDDGYVAPSASYPDYYRKRYGKKNALQVLGFKRYYDLLMKGKKNTSNKVVMPNGDEIYSQMFFNKKSIATGDFINTFRLCKNRKFLKKGTVVNSYIAELEKNLQLIKKFIFYISSCTIAGKVKNVKTLMSKQTSLIVSYGTTKEVQISISEHAIPYSNSDRRVSDRDLNKAYVNLCNYLHYSTLR